MPSTIHIDVDPALRKWLEHKAKQLRLSKNSVVKMVLHAAWRRDETALKRARSLGMLAGLALLASVGTAGAQVQPFRPQVFRPQMRGPSAVIRLPPRANPYQMPRILPMEPMGRTVLEPMGPVGPGMPGFRYELDEAE